MELVEESVSGEDRLLNALAALSQCCRKRAECLAGIEWIHQILEIKVLCIVLWGRSICSGVYIMNKS